MILTVLLVKEKQHLQILPRKIFTITQQTTADKRVKVEVTDEWLCGLAGAHKAAAAACFRSQQGVAGREGVFALCQENGGASSMNVRR